MLSRDFVPAKAVLEARKRMNDAVRRFFDERGFLEVETPIAVVSPGLEPHLEPFETTEIGPDRVEQNLFLHTSPEYAMKRMLGRGLGHIYQLARVFRNGERSNTHAPEFTMLEWYRSPGTLEEIMDDTEALITRVAEAVDGPWRPEGFERVSTREAFVRLGLADPLEHEVPSALAAALGVRLAEGDTWDDIFFRAFLERVEPSFDARRPTLLHGYPAGMAALAKIDPADPKTARRFEVYAGSLELANAFDELTDPDEQRRRFEHDLRVRAAIGQVEVPIDEGLLDDLRSIGQAAGIALGLDRLLMRCLGLDRIQDLLSFSPRDDQS